MQWLDEIGYDSYLIGQDAALLRLSGGCWRPDYETWAWSNVVAVSRVSASGVASRLDAASTVRPAPPRLCS